MSVRRSETAPRRVYVDTSAYVAVLLGEDGADDLARDVTNTELLSSVLLVLEAKRTLVRLAREGTLKADHYKACLERLERDLSGFVLRDLTRDLCDSNLMPAVATPRSLDLAHLRTALWFHADQPLARFLTTDSGQAQAARELGLPA